MSFIDKKEKQVDNNKAKKESWLTRLANGSKKPTSDTTGHCGNFSSVVCLRCDKCWAAAAKKVEEASKE
jgi:hypothetical protein